MSFINKFEELNKRNVNDHVEKKNGLNYLSWAFVQQELTKIDENFEYRIKEFPDPKSSRDDVYLPYLVSEEGYLVNVEITLFGKTKSEWLPVLDYKNKSIPKGQGDMFAINKAHKRAFVKCAAQFGLGNYLYLGEDMPEQPKAKPEHIKNLKEKIAQAVEIGGDDASEQKVMQWLRISDYDTVTEAQINPMIKRLNELIDSKRSDK